MNQRKTNTLLFIAVIALAIMILLLIISQAGRGNTSTANSGGKGTSRGLADHLKGTSSSTENAETPSTNAPPVTAPINNKPPGGSVTETNAPAVVPPTTNSNLQTFFIKPSQPQAKPSQPQAKPSQPQAKPSQPQAKPAGGGARNNIGQRLDREGAKTGQVQISLAWDTYADLDLHVVDPSGVELSFLNKRSASGGELDVDMNVTPESLQPVENIFWPENGAPRGRYRVSVVCFTYRGNGRPVQFMVRLKINGKVQIKRGWVKASGIVHAADFNLLPPPPNRR